MTDPLEHELKGVGLVAFQDPKSGEILWRHTGGGFLSRFKKASGDAQEARDKAFRRMKIDAISLRTGEPYTKALLQYFRARAKRH